ncbi:MAG TPA: GDP-mannose 4,6-dehydratase [Fimbriimonadaceae bacterium]|nr:GDP-mannose 4,6-dehydratase [Fimbriimonadaceae bacterium]
MKTALITGISGQDGYYLAHLLSGKGYEVHGVSRTPALVRDLEFVHLHGANLTDRNRLLELVEEVRPDEIYNLGAQSHVGSSFDQAEYTGDVDGLGVIRLLDSLRAAGLADRTRFYQASSSELYGLVQEVPQSESTPFHPRSPYGVAKLYAYWTVVTYREAYGIHASNGILFNHESPRRPTTFVTRKISQAAARISLGLQDKVSLGNLNARRDWGHAREYVEAMWRMLQHPAPDDYVVATGTQFSIRDFVAEAFRAVGIELEWEGEDVHEVGRDSKTGIVRVDVDPAFFRIADVENIVGDATKAKLNLNWEPKFTLKDIVCEMVESDLKLAESESLLMRSES